MSLDWQRQGPEELEALFDGQPDVEPTFLPGYFQDLAVALRDRNRRRAVRFLLERLPHADAPRVTAILLALTMPPRVRGINLKQVISRYLLDPRPAVLAAALDAFRSIGGSPAVTKRAQELMLFPEGEVRAAALRYVASVASPAVASDLLVSALHDPHPLVRESAVDELDEREHREAIPCLGRLRDDPDPHVRQAVDHALGHLTA